MCTYHKIKQVTSYYNYTYNISRTCNQFFGSPLLHRVRLKPHLFYCMTENQVRLVTVTSDGCSAALGRCISCTVALAGCQPSLHFFVCYHRWTGLIAAQQVYFLVSEKSCKDVALRNKCKDAHPKMSHFVIVLLICKDVHVHHFT